MQSNDMRPWAKKRRTQYGSTVGGFFFILLVIFFFAYIYEPANCLDLDENGGETGVDCGGKCARICTLDVLPPNVLWVEAFRISEGLYNAVAYVENRNLDKGVEKLSYVFKLFDDEGMILERAGETEFPPDATYPLFEGRIQTGDRIPTHATLELEDNPVWVKAEKNSARYMIERRELTGADRKPVLTAVIKNESREEAEDVDVVATIFNAQNVALTASRTKVPLFSGGSTKQVTFTWQEPIAKTIRSCEVATDVVVAIDLSGSMNNDGGEPPQPITSVLKAAQDFVLKLNKGDQVSLVTFASDAELISKLSENRSEVATLINNLEIKPESEQGSTNTGDAILFAEYELSSERNNEDARRAVVLLTDGLATAPDPEPETYARDAATKLKASGIELFTIGLGADVNDAFLGEIATDRKHYFRAPTTVSLGKIYESITTELCEEGAAVIDIVTKPQATYTKVE